MDTALKEKLLMKAGKTVLVINAPIDFWMPSAKKSNQNADVTLVFVRNEADISSLSKMAIGNTNPDGVLWFAYPKKSSGVKTDINRDSGWEPLAKNKFVPVTQVAIDETWSALRFKSIDQIKKLTRKTAIGQQPSKPNKEKMLELSTAFQQQLSKNEKAGVFFRSLSFTNRKEYVVWLESAKKSETKKKRLTDAIEKLLSGKRNPSEK